MLNEVRIDDLQSNREYQLHLKVNTEAGELIQVISFRTNNDQDEFDSRSIQSYLIVTIVLISLLFISITIVITCLLMKLCRRQSQRRKLKTMIYSSYPDHYHGTWLKSNNEFTMENYSTEKIQHRDRPYSFASGKYLLMFDHDNHMSLFSRRFSGQYKSLCSYIPTNTMLERNKTVELFP